MLRPLAEAGEKLHGQEIQEPLEKSPHSVLRPAESARPMTNFNLPYFKTTGGGQDRDEAMKLTIEFDLLEDRSPEALHPAIVIVKPDARDQAHDRIKDPAGKYLVPRV